MIALGRKTPRRSWPVRRFSSSAPPDAQIVRAIIDKAQLLSMFPRLGRPLTDHGEFRQIVLQVLNAPYVFQYRYDGTRVVMLRMFHGREHLE